MNKRKKMHYYKYIDRKNEIIIIRTTKSANEINLGDYKLNFVEEISRLKYLTSYKNCIIIDL